MSALLLDVGNSRLKWGIYADGDMRRTGHIAHDKLHATGLSALTTRLPRRVDAVWASNVAGNSFATRLSGVLGMHCNADIHFARSEKRGWGIVNGYRQPRLLGDDRWVAMIAAYAELNSACVVVDVGTAVTIDALDDEGNHLGGQILPGIETMLQSLSTSTSDIPVVKASTKRAADDLKMFGRNTAAAVREGSQNAIAGAVDRAMRSLQSNGFSPTIVLTGGGASRILGAVEGEPLHRPNLVLHGLAHMLENER